MSYLNDGNSSEEFLEVTYICGLHSFVFASMISTQGTQSATLKAINSTIFLLLHTIKIVGVEPSTVMSLAEVENIFSSLKSYELRRFQEKRQVVQVLEIYPTGETGQLQLTLFFQVRK
jgi:hypothetical protein